jgi:hypothetical protein
MMKMKKIRMKQTLTLRKCPAEDRALREQLRTLKSCEEDTKSAVISWGNQAVQMLFSPSQEISESDPTVKGHWGIQRSEYWISINWKHESIAQEWPKESSVVVKIKGLGAGKALL